MLQLPLPNNNKKPDRCKSLDTKYLIVRENCKSLGTHQYEVYDCRPDDQGASTGVICSMGLIDV